MNLWEIVVGLATAALLIHFRSSYLRAQEQLLVAARLRSYLLYWNTFVLEHDLFSIFNVGVQWNKDIDEVLAKGGGAEELVKLHDEKKKDMVEGFKKHMESNEIPFDIAEFQKRLVSWPPENAVEEMLKASRQFEQNVFDAKTFISDEDGSALGVTLSLSNILCN